MAPLSWIVRASLFFFVAASPGTAAAQAAEEAQISGQPLVYLKSGKVDGCGARMIAVMLNPQLRTGKGIDASVNVWGRGAAVKGLSYSLDVEAMAAGRKPKTDELEGFWLKGRGDATHPADGKFHSSDDPGAKIYPVPMEAAQDLLMAILDDQSITLAVKRISERGQRLYFGKVAMSDAEKQQVLGCLSDLSKR